MDLLTPPAQFITASRNSNWDPTTQRERQPSTTSRNTADVSGLELIRDGLPQSRRVCCGVMSLLLKLFLDTMDITSFRLKRKWTIHLCSWVIVHRMRNLHTCEGNVNSEMHTQVLERHMPPTGRLFQQHSAGFTTVLLCSKRVQVLDWPVCSPDLSAI